MKTLSRRLNLALNKIDEVYLSGQHRRPLSDAEYCFMYALDDGRPHSQAQICREWLIPKTTLNTVVKRWEREGLLRLSPAPGKRREMEISLTPAGAAYVSGHLELFYRAEIAALEKTLEEFDPSFLPALEAYGRHLEEAFAPAGEQEGL